MHWICLFVDWFQENTTNVRSRDTSHPQPCIPRSIRLLLFALCILIACTFHFASSSGLGRCLPGCILFCCSPYPMRQLDSKHRNGCSTTLLLVLLSPGGCASRKLLFPHCAFSQPLLPWFFSCRVSKCHRPPNRTGPVLPLPMPVDGHE